MTGVQTCALPISESAIDAVSAASVAARDAKSISPPAMGPLAMGPEAMTPINVAMLAGTQLERSRKAKLRPTEAAAQ